MISSGRIGGEEFASLLPNTTPQDALWLAEQVRAAVEIRLEPSTHSVALWPMKDSAILPSTPHG